jgi:hypothetical protein
VIPRDYIGLLLARFSGLLTLLYLSIVCLIPGGYV